MPGGQGVFGGLTVAENLDLAFTVKNTEFIGVKDAAGTGGPKVIKR